jgi:hypothetical protein
LTVAPLIADRLGREALHLDLLIIIAVGFSS